MRISDWISDVCSSDLRRRRECADPVQIREPLRPADVDDLFLEHDPRLAQRKPCAHRPARGILRSRIEKWLHSEYPIVATNFIACYRIDSKKHSRSRHRLFPSRASYQKASELPAEKESTGGSESARVGKKGG